MTEASVVDDIDYQEWVRFIDAHPNYFIWYEDTQEGKDALRNIEMCQIGRRKGCTIP